MIEVSDTDFGISEDDQKKIFEDFYRVQNAKDIDKECTGMGLSIAS